MAAYCGDEFHRSSPTALSRPRKHWLPNARTWHATTSPPPTNRRSGLKPGASPWNETGGNWFGAIRGT
jgi:hypothetical protein